MRHFRLRIPGRQVAVRVCLKLDQTARTAEPIGLACVFESPRRIGGVLIQGAVNDVTINSMTEANEMET